MCEKSAVWDVEVCKRGIHVPVCDRHKNDAAIDLSRKGELVLRPLKADPKPACAYLVEQEVVSHD
jgi:hypothetical protein